tara:strand:- start:129 stop:386 length:258 start_codon:yes stop_codon:yes gene_type:complete
VFSGNATIIDITTKLIMKLNQMTLAQFEQTNFYQKRFTAELKEDLGVSGAERYLSQIFDYLRLVDASLVEDKIQFPERNHQEWVD